MVRHLPLSQVRESLEYNVDVFICCGSYEDRCMSIADLLEPSEINTALIGENTDLAQYVGENTKYLLERFQHNSIHMKLDSTRPIVTGDGLAAALKTVKEKGMKNFLVDITTFTHESLLMLVKLLSINCESDDNIALVYTGASDYSIGEPDEHKWLSKGVADIRSVLGYPGEIDPSKPIHLIVLVGYEHERAEQLIKVVQPDIISLGYGRPGTATESRHQKANEYFHGLLKTITGIYGNVEDFNFACNDPVDSLNAIRSCIERYPAYNHVVAPMNTKLSTVGAAMAAIENEKIQMCYAQAQQYNYKSYSSPGTTCHLHTFKLPQ